MPTSAFELIEETWFSIRDGFDDLLQGATDAGERKRLVTDRDGARDAYYHALGEQFDEQDHFVKQTKAELAAVTADLKSELESLENIAAALNLVSSAVKLMATLAAMFI